MADAFMHRGATALLRQKEAPSGIEIDDPIDVEDRMLRRWVRRHVTFDILGKRFVLANDALPARWRGLTEKFTTQESALQFLRHIAGRGSLSKLRSLNHDVSIGVAATDHRLLETIASALVSGRVWALNRRRFPPPVKVDPAVLLALNARYRTAVDFAFLAQWEGGQHLHAYVPFANDGHVAGKSGVTIATGFDIGQKSAVQIAAMNLGEDLESRLRPFAGVTLKGKDRSEVIQILGTCHAPMPVVNKSEADLLDAIIHDEHLGAAVRSWNEARAANVPDFEKLPDRWQTVIFSRTFHQGPGFPRSTAGRRFYGQATSGEWRRAIDSLRTYPVEQDWYQARVRQEADYLAAGPTPPNSGAPTAR